MPDDYAPEIPSHAISPSYNRRSFLKTAVVSALAVPGLASCAQAPIQDDELRSRAKALLDTSLAIDMHSHVGGTGTKRPIDDFPEIKAGGLSAVCLSLVSDSPILERTPGRIFMGRQPLPDELYLHTLARLDFADRAIKAHGLTRIHNLSDLHASKNSRSAGIILATEGGDFLDGHLDRLNVLHERGIRHFQLVHYRHGNGIGDIQTEPPMENGATAFGLNVVRACNQLGIVVDVAHATFETVKQVVNVATMPLVLSHTAYSTRRKPLSRRIDAEHAKLVSDTGGVIGLWTNARDFSDAAEFSDGMARMADVVGVDHVGIGSDIHGLMHPMFRSYAAFPGLIASLFRHFNDEEVRKIVGGNYVRVFGKVTAARMPAKSTPRTRSADGIGVPDVPSRVITCPSAVGAIKPRPAARTSCGASNAPRRW